MGGVGRAGAERANSGNYEPQDRRYRRDTETAYVAEDGE